MSRTFPGGIHMPSQKITAHRSLWKIPAPDTVSIPLSQHIGAPCQPIVSVGERVLRYQKIGEAKTGLACPVHASVTGIVQEIRERRSVSGAVLYEVVIQNDHTGEDYPVAPPMRDLKFLPISEQIELIKEAGISGMGGATFPTYAKLQSTVGKADIVLINCAECEPYITSNHRLLLEQTYDFLGGVADLARLFGVKTVHIAIEDNKEDAASHLEKVLGDASFAQVHRLKTKYPQGDERQLIYALTGRRVPVGKLPGDVGCAVFNAETCTAIYRALHQGMPLVDKIVTVSGDCVAHPANLLVPIGTAFSHLFSLCGGVTDTPDRILSGGPMMGKALWDLEAPVSKGCGALLALSKKTVAAHEKNHICIRCGRCVEVCPMHLMPCEIVKYTRADKIAKNLQLDVNACTECGCCAYVCPGKIPLVQYIGVAKAKLRSMTQTQQLTKVLSKPEEKKEKNKKHTNHGNKNHN